MKISTTKASRSSSVKSSQKPKRNELESPKESVTLTSSRKPSWGNRILWTGAATVPLVGAGVNYLSALSSGIDSEPTKSDLLLGGAVSNLIGTASLTVGLIAGSTVASGVGLGFLVGSGVALAVASS